MDVKKGEYLQAANRASLRDRKLEAENYVCIMMPRLSGYGLTQTIRERFSISELSILLFMGKFYGNNPSR
jgi:hypothetical protein